MKKRFATFKYTSKAIASLLILLFSLQVQAKLLERIYAVVNGETITLTEIEDYQNKLKNGGFLNDLLFSDPAERQKALSDKDYLLKLLVDEKIIDFEVKQNGFLVTQERVSKEISDIASRQNVTVAQLRSTLEQQGINYAEYQDFVKKSIERRQLVEKEITSKIKISEQDIVSHYISKNATNSTQVFEYNLSHILIKPSDKSVAEDLAKKLKADESSFEKFVKEHSTDDDTKNKNGFFGHFKTGEMIASIEKAIRGLNIGETSSVVTTPMGLHIFKLTDKKLVDDPAIQKAKQSIYQELFAKEFKEQLSFWLIQKRKDAIIQINKS